MKSAVDLRYMYWCNAYAYAYETHRHKSTNDTNNTIHHCDGSRMEKRYMKAQWSVWFYFCTKNVIINKIPTFVIITIIISSSLLAVYYSKERKRNKDNRN